MNKLEVIAWTKEDAINIEKAGAHRIEFVSEIEKGGLTPSIELVKETFAKVSIPIMVMVRDRDKSFIYNDETMDSHIKFIKELTKTGVEGIVYGSLTEQGEINFKQLERVIEAKGNMKLTFHRAFDELGENVFEQFDKLSKYDVDTILTSGTKENAVEGITILKELVERKTINILPGKSISIDNAKMIIESTGADYIHVGYAIREDGTKNTDISYKKIQTLIKEMNND